MKFRFEIFQQNILKINTQNLKYQNGQSTYSAGLNRFSDWVYMKLCFLFSIVFVYVPRVELGYFEKNNLF